MWPANGTTGPVLDLAGTRGTGAAVIGQEPTLAAGPSPSPVAPASAAAPLGTAAPLSTADPLAIAAPASPIAPPASGAPATPTDVPPPPSTPLTTPSLPPSLIGAADPLRLGVRPVATAPPVESLVGYVWPLAHPRLTLPFGPTVWGSRWVNGQRFHDGVDLATFCGDRIVAAHTGTVFAASRRFDAFMGWIGDLRPYLRRLDQKHLWSTLPIVVVIDDGNGYRSVYAHFSRVVVKPGQTVKAGQLLGYEGMTGRASGCHLHYDLFSPLEQTPMAIRSDVVKRMKLPTAEIARIDPLLVLPPRAGINAPAKPKPRPTAAP